jgi:hypothetical protein
MAGQAVGEEGLSLFANGPLAAKNADLHASVTSDLQ